MNKKFLVVALLAALSTVGFAYDLPHTNAEATDSSGKIGATKGNENFNSLAGAINGLQQELNNAAIGRGELSNQIANNKTEIDSVKGDVADIKGQVGTLNGSITDINGKLEGKLDRDEFAQAQENIYDSIAESMNYSDGKDKLQNEKIDANTNAIEGLKQEIDNAAIGRGELSNQIADNKTEIDNIKGNVEGVKDQVNDLQEGLGKLESDLDTKVENTKEELQNAINGNTQQIVDLNNSKLDKDQYENDKLAQEKRDEEQDGKIHNVSQRLENFKDQVNSDNAAQNDIIANNTADIDDLKENKVDKEQYENDKLVQAGKDKEQDDKIDLGNRVNNIQNQQIGNLQSQNLEQDRNIQSNKDAIAANKAEQDKVNAAQKENNKQQQEAIDKNTSDIKDHGNRLDTLENNYAQYDGRLSGLEKKVDHLDDKMNKGLSLMAAMNAVDFQNVQTGEMALGAGIGHYGNAQSVALGVAYSPVEDLTVNAKYSVTAGDADSFAVGAGATYKFKVGR